MCDALSRVCGGEPVTLCSVEVCVCVCSVWLA